MLRFASTIILLAAVASKAYAEFADQLCNVESLAVPVGSKLIGMIIFQNPN